jgi:hypothetical protein
MYIYIYISTYTYIHTYHVYDMYVCIHIYTQILARTYTITHTLADRHEIFTCPKCGNTPLSSFRPHRIHSSSAYTHTHTYIHTYIHITPTHLHLHTHTHTNAASRVAAHLFGQFPQRRGLSLSAVKNILASADFAPVLLHLGRQPLFFLQFAVNQTLRQTSM